MMDEQALRIIEARLEAAEALYTTTPEAPAARAEQAACCLDWTRAVAMPDLHLLLAEVRRLRAGASYPGTIGPPIGTAAPWPGTQFWPAPGRTP